MSTGKNNTVSIIINNHNYEHYLADSIQSAIRQTWPELEIIVVDDGSDDGSHAVIERFKDHVIPVYKTCGGQASALNAGFSVSTGDVVIFLDADDRLLESAASQCIELMQDNQFVKIHWPMWVIDKLGHRSNRLHPKNQLPSGNLSDTVLVRGPTTLLSSPTSGNAWSRQFLEQVLPIPENIFKISADKYLIELAPVHGLITALTKPLGEYRRHGSNAQYTASAETQLARELQFYDCYAPIIAAHFREQGKLVSQNSWKKNSWWHRQEAVIAALARLPQNHGTLVLADDGVWGLGCIAGWQRLPFLEHNGVFGGLPENSHHAIAEIERLKDNGATLLMFPWHSFWWFDAYEEFFLYMQSNYKRQIDHEWAIAFDLLHSE